MQHADEIGSAQPGATVQECPKCGVPYAFKAIRDDRVALVRLATSLNADVQRLQSEVYRCEGEIEDLKRKLTIAESKAGAP